MRDHDWNDMELAKLIAAYADRDKPVALDALATELGRNKANVCRKARGLGLTNQKRAKVDERKPGRKYATDDDLRAAQSRASKDRIAKNGHPRGALGLRHSGETKAVISRKSRAMWADPKAKINSPESAQRRSDQMIARIAEGSMRAGYSRSRGGKRADLDNVYFRSSWEANYARYLNLLVERGEIREWHFEPKTFVFEAIKRGTRAYTPDFKVVANDGSHVWHEVKGWMDAKSKTRLARFAKYFPHEPLIVVDAKWFRSARKSLASLIAGWESGTVR